MDGVQNPHDEYVNSQWVDLGSLQQHGHHMMSPHHHQDFGAPYGFVESPGFAPPDSPFRLQPAPMPMAQNYMGMQQWTQTMAPPTQPMTTTHQHYPNTQAIAPAPPHLAPAAAISTAPLNPTQSTSSPRRTLTDADRRRMCIFHEEHPNVKQTEIGAMFGVERSTVSKVLRQKEKYLFPDDGSRSPVKRSKGKFPDIERALSVWAKNTRKQGVALTDVMIREKARFFATSVGISDSHFKANSAGWLEKFKQKNNLHPGGRARAESDVTGIARGSAAAGRLSKRPGHVRTESTPNVKRENGSSSPSMQHSKSQDSQNNSTDSPDSFMDFTQGINTYHQQNSSGTASTTSLSSTFTNSGYLGPASPASPFFSPEARIDSAQPSPGFSSSQQARLSQRPRSQTMPLIGMDPSCISPPPSSGPLTPKMLNGSLAPPTTLASPANDIPNPLASPHNTPSSSHTALSANGMPDTPMTNAPTRDDAKQALEVVMSFLRQQPLGFVEQDDYLLVGKLLGKFELNGGPLDPESNMNGYSSIPPS